MMCDGFLLLGLLHAWVNQIKWAGRRVGNKGNRNSRVGQGKCEENESRESRRERAQFHVSISNSGGGWDGRRKSVEEMGEGGGAKEEDILSISLLGWWEMCGHKTVFVVPFFAGDFVCLSICMFVGLI